MAAAAGTVNHGMIDILLTSGLALISTILIMVIRWVMTIVADREKLTADLTVTKIDLRLEPRFSRLESQVERLSQDIHTLRRAVEVKDGRGAGH